MEEEKGGTCASSRRCAKKRLFFGAELAFVGRGIPEKGKRGHKVAPGSCQATGHLAPRWHRPAARSLAPKPPLRAPQPGWKKPQALGIIMHRHLGSPQTPSGTNHFPNPTQGKATQKHQGSAGPSRAEQAPRWLILNAWPGLGPSACPPALPTSPGSPLLGSVGDGVVLKEPLLRGRGHGGELAVEHRLLVLGDDEVLRDHHRLGKALVCNSRDRRRVRDTPGGKGTLGWSLGWRKPQKEPGAKGGKEPSPPLTDDVEREVVLAADGADGAAGAAGVDAVVVGAGAPQGEAALLAADGVGAAAVGERGSIPKPLPRGAARQGREGERGARGLAAAAAGLPGEQVRGARGGAARRWPPVPGSVLPPLATTHTRSYEACSRVDGT